MPQFSYDAVIATRNRAEALALSIPLLLRQSCPPSRLIVIDSSDDHAAVAKVVRAATSGWSGKVIIEASAPGLPHQRNLGLGHVTAPVVLFPDDDSLLYPDTAAEILAVYARDSDAQIAAVCAAEAMTPPTGAVQDATYEVNTHHRREARIRGLRNRIERRLTVLKPAMYLGQILNLRHAAPDWLEEMNVVPVEYMTGFRMSFRTDAIRAVGFDESLGGYAVDEDIDASFSAMRTGLVVGARSARIYHHRCPGGRGAAYLRGKMEVLNRAYVLLKHASGPSGSVGLANTVWRKQQIFCALKLLSLLRGVASEAGRARLAGAWDGSRQAAQLWYMPSRDWSRIFARVSESPRTAVST